MPLETGTQAAIGSSSDVKQDQARLIFTHHMAGTYNGVMEKYRRNRWRHHQAYLYWDLHAGPGRYTKGLIGSPLIALEVAGALGVELDAGLFERDPATAQRLRGVLGEARTHYPELVARFRVIDGDHTETVPRILERVPSLVTGRAFGLVYADPNGLELPMGVLRQIAGPWLLGRLDFLAYVSATNYKRRRGAHLPDAPYLEDHLRAFGKPYVWIREPMAQHQWTFVLASGWEHLPVPAHVGFHRWDSVEGRAVLHELNLSTRERQNGHGTTD